MKYLIHLSLLIICTYSHGQQKTEEYYKTLIGNTYYQISNPKILEKGDTMVLKFVDSVHIETGFSHLLNNNGKLHNNSYYTIDCKRTPCSITMTHFYYDSLGVEQPDSSYFPYKGIIEMLTNSAFRVRFITDHMDKSPLTFYPKDHPDIVTFKIKN